MKVKMIQCDECGKMCKGPMGVKMHKRWEHSARGGMKMMRAARRTAKMRIGKKRRIVAHPESTETPVIRKQGVPVLRSLGEGGVDYVRFCPKCCHDLRPHQVAMQYRGGNGL